MDSSHFRRSEEVEDHTSPIQRLLTILRNPLRRHWLGGDRDFGGYWSEQPNPETMGEQKDYPEVTSVGPLSREAGRDDLERRRGGLMRNPNSAYARRNPFGAGFDAGGGVQSNVGAGGAGPMWQPSQGGQGWTGTSQGFGGGGKGSGYGMGKGGMSGMNQNYGPGFGQQQGQGFSVPWGYFNQAQQYNPLLYAGLSGMGMQPRPWQYNNPMPLFQSQNTFNQYQPQAPQQQGGGGFSVLPNFDQNGQIISIPQGVTWGTPDAGGAPNWLYNGSHTTQNQIPGFGDPNAGTPLNQYTGAGPWGGGGQPAPSGPTGPGTGQQNTTGPFSMAGSAAPAPTQNPWEGVGGFHAARGGAIEGGRDMQPDPFLIHKRC